MIGYYQQPGRKLELDKELTYFVDMVKRRYKDIPVTVLGDFNRSKQALN